MPKHIAKGHRGVSYRQPCSTIRSTIDVESHIHKMSNITWLFKCLLRNKQAETGILSPYTRFNYSDIPGLNRHHGFHAISTLSQVDVRGSRCFAVSSTPSSSECGSADRARSDATVYVNELCMQVDQLLLRCKDPEDIFTLLVTHRGAMFLHNLVTALRLLQGFAEEHRLDGSYPDADDLFYGYSEVFRGKDKHVKQSGVYGTGKELPEEKTLEKKNEEELESGEQYPVRYTETEKEVIKRAREEILVHFENPANQHYLRASEHSRPVAESIVRDERYDLLMHDLYANRNKLDVESACHIIVALDSLQHKYFRLYNGILRHLMHVSFDLGDPVQANRMGKLLLKACHCYVKAGYYDIPLYSKVCRDIYKKPIENHIPLVDKEILMETLKLFSKVEVYDPGVFANAAVLVPKMALTPADISNVALAYAAHKNCTKTHDAVLGWVENQVRKNLPEFTTRQLACCVYSFGKMGLYFPEVFNTLSTRLIDDLETATRSYAKTVLTIPQMALVLENIANYAPDSPVTKRLIHSLLLYLEDLIDDVDEASAISIAFALCVTESQDLNRYMSSFVWRMIGQGTDWENHKYRIFAMWMYQIICFPELNINIPKRCVTYGMREWLLRHGNGPQFPREFEEIASILEEKLGLERITSNRRVTSYTDELDETGTPDPISALSSIDLTVKGKTAKIILNEMNCRNCPTKPIGVDLIIQRLIRRKGFLVHSINYQYWVAMSSESKVRYLEDLIQQLE